MEDFDAPIDFDDIFILDDQIIKVDSTIYIYPYSAMDYMTNIYMIQKQNPAYI